MSAAEQAYLNKFFPNGAELPRDRLIPALFIRGEVTEMLLLVKASADLAELLRSENDGRIRHTDIAVKTVPNGDGKPDLRLELELGYDSGSVVFHGLISDPEGSKQGAIVSALLLVNRIALFVAGYDMAFVSFKAFDWNPAAVPQLIDMNVDYNGKGT